MNESADAYMWVMMVWRICVGCVQIELWVDMRFKKYFVWTYQDEPAKKWCFFLVLQNLQKPSTMFAQIRTRVWT